MLRSAEDWLAARGVEAPRRSAELLLARVLGLDRLQVYLAHDRPMTGDEKAALRPLVARRGQHEPLAYVLGDAGFRGLTLEVGPGVLIPRPETEDLVDRALARLPEGGRFVDLGTGCGAIALALVVERPDVRGIATELSGEALAYARRNLATLGAGDRLELRPGSWWEPLAGLPPFDLVVANPPYVDPHRPELLADDVARFEPERALFTEPGDPASAYRPIAAGCRDGLVEGGWLVLETGVGAAEAARAALDEAPFLDEVELEPDPEGRPRHLRARRVSSGRGR